MARRDAAASGAAVARLLAAAPDYAPGWLTASVLALDLGQSGRALAAAERGLSLAPAQPALRIQHMRCLHALGRRREAIWAARRAADVAATAEVKHQLGQGWAALGNHEEALYWLDAALAQDPNAPRARYNRAAMLRFMGRFDAAEADLDRALAMAPDDWEAYWLRSGLRTQTQDRNHVEALRCLLARDVAPPLGRVHLLHALAKELEDIGEFKESFTQLHEGATLRRGLFRYDVEGDVRTLARIQAVFDHGWRARAGAGHAGLRPIFVIGLPRSGSTLVERILGCHPDVISLGESNAFPTSLMRTAAASGSAGVGKEALVDVAAGLDPARLGEHYAASLSEEMLHAPRFIDKLPANALYAGLIATALPDAVLVHVRRHPMANGYGLYKTLFAQGYPFSYDLDELGRYMVAHARLMAHWRAVLGDRFVEIGYEALVRDQCPETQALLKSCGLSWHEACLAPHRNTAPSQTQSAVQIRAPLHDRALESWRHLSQHLQPLARHVGALAGAG